MNNFLNLLGTRPNLDVVVKIKQHGIVTAKVMLNGYIIDNVVGLFSVDLFSPIQLSVDMLEFEEGTSGIEIELLTVDGLEILPLYQHLATSSTNYIDKKGLWTMEMPAPFYQWYHTISGQGWLLTP